MPLITCPDCGSSISDAAPACPRCGRPGAPTAAIATRPVRSATEPEQVLFQDDLVVVTSTRAVVRQDTTYAMANITSVREFVERPSAKFGVLGSAVIMFGLMGLSASGPFGAVVITIGAILLAAYFLTKPKYWVRIGTAGAEANAIWSHDATWTRNVVAAINAAIVGRG